jgi:hypothetical protein
MKFYELTENEASKTGFTHKAVIAYNADATKNDFTAAATTQTYTLCTAPVGTIVQGAAWKVVTVILGGAISAAVAVVGKTGTTNAYITSTSVFTGAGTVKAGDGASFNQAGGDGLSTAIDLVAVLTTTTANVSVATQGEVHIYLKLVDITKI